MDPLTMGLILSGGTGLLNAFFGNRNNNRNLRAAQQRQRQIDTTATGMMTGGPSEAEQQLLTLLNAGPNQAFNTGQDSLMQMLNQDPYNPDDLFASWEPIEARALDESLSNFWGTSSGLGQRFGSAAARETGRIRGQAAEGAASRRQQATMDIFNTTQNRNLNAATALGNLGLGQQGQAISGFQSLFGAEGNRRNQNAQLLAIMAGLQPPQSQQNQIPGAMMDISQLIMLYPMLKQMMAGGTAGVTPTG